MKLYNFSKYVDERTYINYLAHMLDESFAGDESYWNVWQNENRKYVPTSDQFMKQLLSDFDRYMTRFDDLDVRLRRILDACYNERIGDHESVKKMLHCGFTSDELTNHKYFWDVIPAQTYKAIISRNRAKHHGQISHQVSDRVIKDCLDKICYGAAMIQTTKSLLKHIGGNKTNFDVFIKNTNIYKRLFSLCDNEQATCFILKYMWKACTSIVDDNELSDKFCAVGAGYTMEEFDAHFDEIMAKSDEIARQGGGEWMTNESDSEIGEMIQGMLEEVDCLIYQRPDEAIPLMSRLIDHIHIRGDLAGVFIEGGSATCSYVSNMKPDELYEAEASTDINDLI